MNSMRAKLISIACAFVLVPQIFGVVAHADDGTVKTIDYKDIPDRVRIIGKLGLALGDVTTIRGRWTSVSRAKPTGPIFMVDSVDGKPLNQRAEFTGGEIEPVSGPGKVSPAIGEVWELRGEETGGFRGIPPKLVEEEFRDGRLQRPSVIGYGFYTKFIYLSMKKVSGEPPPPNTSPTK